MMISSCVEEKHITKAQPTCRLYIATWTSWKREKSQAITIKQNHIFLKKKRMRDVKIYRLNTESEIHCLDLI